MEQAGGGFPLGLGLVVEDRPSELSCTLGLSVGGGALDKRDSRSTRALEELAVEGAVDWKREEEKGPPPEEEAELAGMGGASGMDTGCCR